MRSNVEGCNDLKSQIKRFLGLLETLAKSLNGRTDMISLKDSFKNDICEFERLECVIICFNSCHLHLFVSSAMGCLEARLKDIAKQNRFKRFLASASNKNQIADIGNAINKELLFFQARQR